MGSRVPPANGASKLGFQKLENRVTIQLNSRSKQEMREIKRKLVSELEIVRRLLKKIEEMDRIPATESNKMSKSGNKKQFNNFFKNCGILLEKLRKHKHGWVFNKPVDLLTLGLTDYFDIIKHPMDLGTVKSRLDKNWYNSPMEFAEDVRLTFHNAMTYNPKGQDVHAMAELLLTFFEEKWKLLEVSKLGKISSLKKPKAKELEKREMTYEEKQNLSINLQNLPSEKRDHVVQIIMKRTPLLSQNDDEIEVDIDTFDIETLWELDRFVNNYKKDLIKNKRKPEFPNQDVIDIEPNVQDCGIILNIRTLHQL